MRLLLCAVAFLLFTTHPDPAFACLCGSGGPPCQAYFRVDAVFAGTVTAISRVDGPPDRPFLQRLVSFATVRAFRGVEGTQVDVFTFADEGGCGYEFKIGRRYLVYARRIPEGRLTTSICSRTGPLADATEDLKFIEGLRADPVAAHVSGTITHRERDFATGVPRHYPPVPDLQVQLRGAAGTRETRTDTRGRYYFTSVEPGEYEVQVFPPSVFSSRHLRSEIDISEPRGCAVADFNLNFDGRVTGMLRTASGQPISGVTVQMMAGPRSKPRGAAESIAARTDAAGYYELSEVPPGDYVVGVALQPVMQDWEENVYPRTFYPGTSEAGSAGVIRIGEGNRVELEPMVLPAARVRRQLAGVVVQPDGTPVPGASISLTDGEPGWRQVALAVKSDDRGRFEFTVYDGLSYVAQALYVVPDDPTHRQANGWSSAFVVSAQTPPLLVVVIVPAPRR
jgi:hypothetical protein